MTFAVVTLLAVVIQQPQAGYPFLYRELKLPEMPAATVSSAGRQSTSLADGIRIDLETVEDVAAVLRYFREQMRAGGWSETPSRAKVALATIGQVEFTKALLIYTVRATRLGSKTTVQLNLLERAR